MARKSKVNRIIRESEKNKSYSAFFERVTTHIPYNFQKKVFENYTIGKNILLKAPTGAGKTWASIVPFIYTYINNQVTISPKKLIYSLPLRTLANSLYNKIGENEIIKSAGLKVSLQTGDTPNDILFESDIIFTTIDQTLSSILGFPYSLSKRQANINAGAIIGSYLIFDEFHLLDPARSLITSLNILKRLKGLSRFCVMTATISNKSIDKISKFLGSIPVIIDDKELASITKLKNEKTITVKKKHIEVDDILREHKRKTIVICNTVERAQNLYNELKTKKPNTELICIHSRFFKRDRLSKEKKIVDTFGKESSLDKEAILISTQVIEVGLDISCNTLHTEISPINSFLQRAGRCARFEGERGKIFVYDTKKIKGGSKSYLPYDKDLCLQTMEELEKKQILNYSVGEDIVNRVLTSKEVKSIDNAEFFDFSRITNSWEESNKNVGRELIRDINSTDIVVLRKSEGLHSMYNYEAISINPHTLINKLKPIEEKIDAREEPLVALIEENNIFSDFEAAEFTMTPIENIEDIKLYPRVVLNPKYINYNDEIGLNFLLKGRTIESTLQETEKTELFKYRKETYEEHITKMINIYETNFIEKIRYPLLEIWHRQNFITPIDEMIKFMIIMHDYGKLNKKWQKIARSFQKTKGDNVENELLAHTDFDPQKDKLSEKLPPHAGIGAMVSFSILEYAIPENRDNEFRIIAKALFSAILKHHSISSHEVNPYQIEDKGVQTVSKMIKKYAPSFCRFDNNKVIKTWENTEDLSQYVVDFNNFDEVFLYFLLVRVLRLCDQKSIDLEGKLCTKTNIT